MLQSINIQNLSADTVIIVDDANTQCFRYGEKARFQFIDDSQIVIKNNKRWKLSLMEIRKDFRIVTFMDKLEPAQGLIITDDWKFYTESDGSFTQIDKYAQVSKFGLLAFLMFAVMIFILILAVVIVIVPIVYEAHKKYIKISM